MKRALVPASLLLAGCTLGGDLAAYEIRECSVDADCFGLGHPAPCQEYACLVDTRRCIVAPLDADADGDPPIACGGTDCDDADSRNSGKLMETCDGLDNNCNGAADEGLLTAVAVQTDLTVLPAMTSDAALVQGTGNEVFASFLAEAPDGGECIVDLARPSAGIGSSGCAPFGSLAPLAPRQPSALYAHDQTALAAFVRSDGCGGMAIRSSDGSALDDPCGTPASLPSLSPAFAGSPVLVTYFDAPLSARVDPEASCPAAQPAKLYARVLATAPTAWGSPPILLSSNSVSVRPAASIPDIGLLVAPDDGAASVWVLGSAVAFTVTKVATFPSLAGATSVAAANDGTRAIGVAAEIGCAPSQELRFAVASAFDSMHVDAVRTIAILKDVDIAGAYPTSIAAAWTDSRYAEWRLAWVSQDGGAWVQRLQGPRPSHTPEGPLEGDPIEPPLFVESALAGKVVAAAPTRDGGVVLVHEGGEYAPAGAVEELALRCR